MRRIALGSLSVALLATVSCGTGVPNEGSGRDALIERIDSGSSSRLRVEKFAKTDGQLAEIDGVRTYRMEYLARVETVQSVFITFGDGLSSSGILSRALVAADTSEAFSWGKFYGQSVAQGRPALAGDALTVHGTIAYQLKESGWRVSRVAYDATVDTTGRTARRRAERKKAIDSIFKAAEEVQRRPMSR